MARLTTIKTNFTAGELSPRLLGRVDVSRYHNGARTLRNAYPLVHGGARRRAGTRYAAAAKNATKPARLVPFIFSRTQAFMLELGETYIRFYIPSGQVESAPGVAYEIASPWDDTELEDLKYVQGADTMFFAHPSYAMRKLVRYANTNWKLSQVVFEVPPSDEIGERPATTLTLSAVTGAGVTATAGAASFQDSDVGRFIDSGAGRAEIVGFTSTTTVTVDVDDDFASVNIASGAWTITESPKTTVTPDVLGPLSAAITLTAGANAWKNTAQVSYIGMFVEINDGLVELTGITSALIATGIVRTPLISVAAAPSEGWALRQTIWNSVDGFPRALTIDGQRLIAAGSAAYPNGVAGSRIGEYFNFAEGTADSDGFFFVLGTGDQTPIEHLASVRALIALSNSGETSIRGGNEKPITPTNVQAKSETVYGADFPRPVRAGSEIIFVQRGRKKIRALGYRFEIDAFNAPDVSVLSEHISGDGLGEIAFQQEPDQVVWMVRDDGALVSMSIDRDQDAIGFAHHDTDGEFESIAVIPDESTDQLWAVVVREINGVTTRYVERFEEGLQTDCTLTGAVAESAIVSAAWAAGIVTVQQTAHGYATHDMIRLSGFTPSAYDGEHEITKLNNNTYAFPLAADPGAVTVAGTAAKATVNWSGLGHLEAKTVDIVADGYVATPKTVVAGAITLNKAAYSVEIGLHYKSTIKTLPPEVQTGQGVAQGNAISIHEIIVRLYASKGGTINGQPINMRDFGAGPVLDQPIPEFTGDKRAENLGWGRTGSGDSDGSVTIEQDQPLPQQVLAVILRLSVNDG